MDKKSKQVRRPRTRKASPPPPPDTSLKAYKAKRDFSKTDEPKPEVEKGHKRPIFVIQEHHATRLHYDLRLEADGVLKSWAVTKEPTMDPSVKRLAVRVEDHPLGYATFTGDIPKGEYGAGHVEIWDKGTYEAVQPRGDILPRLQGGKIEIELKGGKMKGRFALVRMAGRGRAENWLLIKMSDRHARRDPATASRGDGKAASKVSKSAGAEGKVVSRGEPEMPPFTSQDKVMFPEVGVTKGEVLRFYQEIAPYLLPHLRDRPVTLERLPEGVGGNGGDAPRFFQKNTPAYYPGWLPRINLPSEAGKPVNYAVVNDVEALLYLVNQGALTFHVWFSRVADLDRPDYVLYDLDPGGAPFTDVVTIAKTLYGVLNEQRVESFVKTSGKSGLHVLVPWRRDGGYDEARAWAMDNARRLVAELPEIATVERSKARRDGRVYVDVMQNVKGHHAVAPYVLRAVPQATVSTPLEWRELTPALDPRRFKLRTILPRLKKQKTDLLGALAS